MDHGKNDRQTLMAEATKALQQTKTEKKPGPVELLEAAP